MLYDPSSPVANGHKGPEGIISVHPGSRVFLLRRWANFLTSLSPHEKCLIHSGAPVITFSLGHLPLLIDVICPFVASVYTRVFFPPVVFGVVYKVPARQA